MLPTALKTTNAIDYVSKLTEFIEQNNGTRALNDLVKGFISDLQQNRNVIFTLKYYEGDLTRMKCQRDCLIKYVNQITLLRKKVFPKKDDEKLKISFSWYDNFGNINQTFSSFSCDYYCTLYNLGVVFFLIGRDLAKIAKEDKVILKEVIKSYTYSAGIFNKIKTEAYDHFKEDLPKDMSISYMNYLSKLCVIYAQIELIHVVNIGPELKAELSKGISDLFKDAASLINNDIASYIHQDFKDYCLNRAIYWESQMFLYLKDHSLAIFEKTANCYGRAIAYQREAISKMKEYGKNLDRFTGFTNIYDFSSLLSTESDKLKDMEDKNARIYYDFCPSLVEEKYEGKIKAEVKLPPEFDNLGHELDSLLCQEIKDMIETFNKKMHSIIQPLLRECENKGKIDQFIIAQGLDKAFDLYSPSDSISDELWNLIFDVSKKGGPMKLLATIDEIILKSIGIENKINNTLTNLEYEDKEDTLQRNHFQAKWARDPSSKINVKIVQDLNNTLNYIKSIKDYDQDAKKVIQKHYEEYNSLIVSKNTLEEKIPYRNAPRIDCKEEQLLKKAFDVLNVLKGKCVELTESLFSSLHTSDIEDQFCQVYEKKLKEAVIYDKQKMILDEKIIKLKELNNVIKANKEDIMNKNLLYIQKKPKEDKAIIYEKEKYKNTLKHIAIKFNEKYDGICKAYDNYSRIEKKIDNVVIIANNFIERRNIEKQHLINYIVYNKPFPTNPFLVKADDYNRYDSEFDFLDPQRNLITTLNVQRLSLPSQPQPSPNQNQYKQPKK